MRILINTKQKSSVIRKAIYAFLLLFAIFVIYIIYDVRQAKHMAVDVCKSAVKGMPLEDFLSAFSEKDYKIIKRPEIFEEAVKSFLPER